MSIGVRADNPRIRQHLSRQFRELIVSPGGTTSLPNGLSPALICNATSTAGSRDIEELKSVPFVPRSHPFIERLIGTLRRRYLDPTSFWSGLDLHRNLDRFAAHDNQRRVHAGLGGRMRSRDMARLHVDWRISITRRDRPA
jgi:hypothetical protein